MVKKKKKASQRKIICQNCLKGICKIHSEPPQAAKRPSWDEYFMNLAEIAGTRSTCLRHKLGAVMVKDKRIIATGYNGAPRGIEHCLEVGCLRDKLKIPSGTHHEICMGVHAEQNLVIQAALHGASTEECDVFLTHAPCAVCAKILINAGVKRIVYQNNYPDEFAKKLLKKASVKLVKFNRNDKKKKKTELILGLVGLPCAGKGILSDYLVEKHNFGYASFSGVIKEEIEKRGRVVNRDSLQAVGGELRKNFGSEILAKRVWKNLISSNGQRAVVDGIRGTKEVEFLKKKPNFYLLAVLAKPRIRYQRMINRGRRDEKISWQDFQKMEERDKKAEGRDIDGCLEMADFKIENNGTIKEFQKKIEELLKKLKSSIN